MAKSKKAETGGAQEIELHPDAWERFPEFIKQIAKAGPQHRVKADDRTPKRRKQKQDGEDVR